MISAKLKLHTTQQQFQALRRTQLAYRDGLNAVSRYAYEQGKTSSNLQSCVSRIDGDQSGRQLHLQVLPTMWLYQ